MTSNMTVGKKFSLACVALVLLTIVLGAFSIHSIGGIQTNLQVIVVDSLPGVYEMSMLDSSAFEMRGNFWKHIATEDKGDKAAIERATEQVKQKFQEYATTYEKTITQAEDRQLFANIKPAYDRYLAAWEEVAELSRAGKMAEAIAKYKATADPALIALKEAIHAEVDWNKKQGDKNAEAASATVSQARLWSGLLLAISVLLGSLLAFLITRSVNKALSQAISELSDGAQQVASAASQVSSSSQSLAQGSSEQAASLQETSASSEEINSMARKNTENSQAGSVEMAKAAQLVADSNTRLEEMVASMKDITDSSSKISKIIKVIDEIAFQTNILALNAAVEAARAGEAGMGFAVVADEVRNLAQRCAQAAKDTSALIEESIEKSAVGSRNLGLVAEGIKAITASANHMKTLVDEVNLGSQEQARGIEQIGKAITQMEQVTQTTAANAEESASAAEELNAQSETLKDIVDRLTAMVGGGGAANGHARPVHRRAAAASGKAPQRRSESEASLTALRKAVSPQSRSAEHGAPVLAAHDGGKEAFPLEEQFKEF
jgi:methyl-accepting chemotaxis protein/methyl-accepting chemotaxis protein-1 (serine sensor receptor)